MHPRARPGARRPRTLADAPVSTPESDALSRRLAKAGFKFVGTTIVYAFMQAAGLMDDHVVGCRRSRAGQDSAPRRRGS
ncbi:MAG: DNA-3-methyladenine glycosylase I [Pseudomonadota bacterium]|jgi:DNA-3-methyladenine glycosylase I